MASINLEIFNEAFLQFKVPFIQHYRCLVHAAIFIYATWTHQPHNLKQEYKTNMQYTFIIQMHIRKH